MAKERGWWKLEVNVEINEMDREHIAELILDGYTEGEICVNEEAEDEQDQ